MKLSVFACTFLIGASALVARPEPVLIRAGTSADALQVHVSGDGTRVFSYGSASAPAAIKVFNRSGVLERTLAGHSEPICNIAFSGDGGTLVSTSFDGTALVWKGDQHFKWQGFGKRVCSASVSNDTRRVMAGGDDLIVLGDATGRILQRISPGVPTIDAGLLPTGGTVTLDYKGMISFWDAGAKRVSAYNAGARVSNWILSPGADQIAGVTEDGNVFLIDAKGGLQRTWDLWMNPCSRAACPPTAVSFFYRVAFSGKESLVVGGASDIIVFLSTRPGGEVHRVPVAAQVVAILPSRNSAVVVFKNGSIRRYSDKGVVTEEIRAPGGAVTSAACSRNCEVMAVARTDGFIEVHRLDD